MADYTIVDTGEDVDREELAESFDEFLDETYPVVEIAGATLQPSEVLSELDPIAYREAFNNWIDAEVENGTIREYVEGPVCEDCEAPLTQDDVTESLANYDRLICPDCGADEDAECADCGDGITTNEATMSDQSLGRPLCLACRTEVYLDHMSE